MFLRFYLKGCMLTKTYPGDILTYILKYNLEESMFYRFPAMRGIQANSEYFVCMIPLGVLSKIFIEDSSDVLPEFRAQRKLKEQRIPEIRDYIINNRDSYVFQHSLHPWMEKLLSSPQGSQAILGNWKSI